MFVGSEELLEESGLMPSKRVRYIESTRGSRGGKEVWPSLKAANRLGVTRGTLEAKRNPLAIL